MDEMDDEIDLRDIFIVLWKNRLMIAAIFLIAVVAAGAISFMMPSVYRASCIVALGNFADPIYTNADLVERLLLSDETLQDVIQQLKLDVPLEYFKYSISINRITDGTLAISIETSDKENATLILTTMVHLLVNRSEDNYNKYKFHLTERLAVVEENLRVLEGDLNKTREVLRNLDSLPGISQEQLELSHSRTLEYLRNEETIRSDLINERLSLRRQLDLLENTRIIAFSEVPTKPVAPRRVMIISVAGMLGLMLGVFAAFLREALGSEQHRL